MEKWAAVDIQRGMVVTLRRGSPSDATVWRETPIQAALRWEGEGADGIHVIDLDAVFRTGSNEELVKKIIERARVPVQYGGGIRSVAEMEGWLEAGASRVVVGTLAYKRPEFVRSALRRCGEERVSVAVDYKNGRTVSEGWGKGTRMSAVGAVKRFGSLGVRSFLATAVELDGTAKGTDLMTLRALRKATNAKIFAAGGIRDLRDLDRIEKLGIDSVVIGRALYEGTIKLSDVGSAK